MTSTSSPSLKPSSGPAPRIAPGPRGTPGLGSLVPYRRDPARFLLRLQRDHGQLSRLRMGPYTVHLATSPDAVRRVLTENQSNYVRGKLYEQFRLVMGTGLLTSDGRAWRGHRRAMQPAFARSAVEAIVPNVVRATEEMLTRWRAAERAGEPVELVAEMMRLTLLTLSRSLFGYDIGARTALLKRVVDDSIEVMFPHGYVTEMLPGWLPTSRNRLIRRNRAIYDQVVADIRAHHAETGEGELVRLAEQARDPETGAPWTDREIRDELLTVYLAGHETTATAACWTLYSVATHRSVREELEGELATALGGAAPEAGGLPALEYTRMVIEESLRLYPPIWLYPRDAVEDDVLDGYHIPGGSSLLLSPLVSHRNPEVWANPEEFDPRRFTPEAVRERPRMAYFPFGGGPRMCIGNMMAMLELKIILAMVCQRFRLEPVPGELLGYGDSLISLRPTAEMWVRPRSRGGADHG
ncbi:Cytochrome P450 [Streptomyces zhaozhouensis]|uniref:Cytochrome P450 n=1 Tax=Streptomyces zhaozhouensis TaxID=1300267 RepID=A0A286E0V0_9ACTN|nr:cytochrome P450 [Streptomyces zhaozhouensis]SOD64503.1 Cytochrome P450 [Streptomyces zhaozhouensis]